MSDDVKVRILGPVEVRQNGSWLQPATPQQRLVLALLTLSVGHVVTTCELIDAVWGDEPPRSARNSIQVLLAHLRKTLAGSLGVELRRRGDGYRLEADPDQVDVQRFRLLVGNARRGHGLSAIAAFDQALGLWRGPALADVAATDRADRIRCNLAAERLSAVEDRLGALLDCGRYAEATSELRVLLAEYPLSERQAGLLMHALYRCGRQADALEVFRDLRSRLVGDLGIEPGPELQHLHQRILAHDAGLDSQEGVATDAATSREAGGDADLGRGRAPWLAWAVIPRQLPAPAPHFAGRAAELTTMTALLDRAGEDGQAVPISVIVGTAGVGKTALALHWAHQFASHFPDGQLYVDLRGFDPSQQPLTPAEALRGFLDAVGSPAERAAASLETQAALYRSLLSGRRMLVVLDNARDAAQVRPLLPGSRGCMVLITSRSQLTGLVAAAGAHTLPLDVLTDAESLEVLAGRLGRARVASEPAAAAEVTRLCARLPLALSIAAARLATRPRLSLDTLAAQLRGTQDRLNVLDAGDSAISVGAAFSCSCRSLSPTAARMFRLLGVHHGPDISGAAAASLAGVSLAEADLALSQLTGACLLAERAPGRYALHGLLRAYAGSQADACDAGERRAAEHRLMDHYLHSAYSAALRLDPLREPACLRLPAAGVTPELSTTHEQAMAWFDAEHAGLLAVIARARAGEFDADVWRLAWAMADFLNRRGHWRDWADVQRTALAAAARLSDPAALACVCRLLGRACTALGSHDEAAAHLRQSLRLYQQLGNTVGQAWVHYGLAQLFELQACYDMALRHARQALGLYRSADHMFGRALALNAVGWYSALLGDTCEALTCCRFALQLHRELGHREGEAYTSDSLGYAHQRLGHQQQAIACYRRAIALYHELGHAHDQAATLTRLGDSCLAAGDLSPASDAWQQALRILEKLPHPDTGRVRARLQGLPAVPNGAYASSAV